VWVVNIVLLGTNSWAYAFELCGVSTYYNFNMSLQKDSLKVLISQQLLLEPSLVSWNVFMEHIWFEVVASPCNSCAHDAFGNV
jgi:hypothetical protein